MLKKTPTRTFVVFGLLLLISLVPSMLPAMNFPVYDLTSKAYLSTDIVLVQISTDEAKHKIATVQETLLGNLPIGSRLDQIDGYLSYFAKIRSGDRLILFLESRPRKLDFFGEEFEKAPYAVVPSGVELVDPFGHVHSYHQPMNPGGYFPAGYPWMPNRKPLTEIDARKFPTLGEERLKIIEAIRTVDPARTILGRESNASDVPRLLHFVDRLSSDTSDCDIRTSSAIRQDVIRHIKYLNDPDLLLRAETLAGDAQLTNSAEGFFQPTQAVERSNDALETFKAQRAEFLLKAIADRSNSAEVRRTALNFLLSQSASTHPYSGVAKVLPIDAHALTSIASRIVEVSHSIFSDQNDDAVLRGMCLRFLDLNDPSNVSLAQAVYKEAKSDALRFEIEDVLLRKSDKLFLDLAPPSSEAASIVGVEPPRPGCTSAGWPETIFFGLYRKKGYQTQASRKRTDDVAMSTVLINQRAGTVFEVKEAGNGTISSDGSGSGQFWVEKLEEIPVGEYSIETQFRQNDKLLGHGYGLKASVIEDSAGKRIVLDPEASRERPQLTEF